LAEEDDFDIVPDEDEGRPRSTWLWVGLTAVVALFAFGVGVAFMILSNRMGPGSPTPTATLAAASPTQIAAITGTVTLTPSAVVTNSGTPTTTPTVTVTPTPSVTPTPNCTQPVEGQFMPYYNAAQLGCATTPAAIVWSAFQPFERGSMLWRSDTDTSYVFYENGAWFPIDEGWDGGPLLDRGSPPPGLQTPQRGFGWVWSHDDAIFNGLGWARDQEKGFCATVQQFERGFILRSTDVPTCTPENLYNFATATDWATLLIVAISDAQWGNSPAEPSSVSTPSAPSAQQGGNPPADNTRPAPQGFFDARDATGFTLDGRFEEWPGTWIPMNTIVWGADRHNGPGDLSGNFQVGWNGNGLMLAIRVNDDTYRPGPVGSDLWQGDSIEIQFDRQLAEDFDSTVANADDYQVGIAFDNSLTATRAYLWLPFENESQLALPSAVTSSEQGYQLEILIPWYVFDITTPATDRAYGFNISVNDNDSDGNAQETVISASPARTTHDNPTQWSTLRLIR
jgi:hypothetical protein